MKHHSIAFLLCSAALVLGVSNAPAAVAAGISCSAIVGVEPTTLIVPKLRFNR